MRSRALTSPLAGAPRRGRATAFISASSSHSGVLIDKVTDLSVTSSNVQVCHFTDNDDAGDRNEHFLGLRRAAADRIPLATTGEGQGAGPRDGRRRHTARIYDSVGWTSSSQGAVGARQ